MLGRVPTGRPTDRDAGAPRGAEDAATKAEVYRCTSDAVQAGDCLSQMCDEEVSVEGLDRWLSTADALRRGRVPVNGLRCAFRDAV